MISDFVKGKKQFDYPDRIRQGITLHRAIDRFTDQHPATREAMDIFRPEYRLYSGAFVDVVYDHFLATDENEFSPEKLHSFSLQVYSTLEEFQHLLPERFAGMFPYMRSHNWLYGYRNLAGAERSLDGVVRRAAYLHDSSAAVKLFRQYYQPLQRCYRQFWTDVKTFARGEFVLLTGLHNNM